MPGQSSVSTGMGLGHRDLIDLRRVHVTNPMMWAIEAGTDFWMVIANNDIEDAGNVIVDDGGWTITATESVDGAGADFMSKDDKGTPGHFLTNAAADLVVTPAIFGDYSHAHQASVLVGARALPKYLVLDAHAQFSVVSNDEEGTALGFWEDGGTVASPGDANGAIFSNGTFFGMNNNATEDISTIAVTTTFNWFQIIMDLEQGKTFGKVNGTLISTDGQTITDDQFPVKFGFGVEGGGSNRILFNQVHIYYAWSFPLNPNDF